MKEICARPLGSTKAYLKVSFVTKQALATKSKGDHKN
jgi:hypothetical protein